MKCVKLINNDSMNSSFGLLEQPLFTAVFENVINEGNVELDWIKLAM